jgi:hypothetical protein
LNQTSADLGILNESRPQGFGINYRNSARKTVLRIYALFMQAPRLRRV